MSVTSKDTPGLKSIAVLAYALCTAQLASGQLHMPYNGYNSWLHQSELLLDQKLYGAAAFSAQQHLDARVALYMKDDPILNTDRARYLKAIALLSSGTTSEADSAFISEAYRERVALARARALFHAQKWAASAEAYKQAGIDNLSNKEVASSKFERAYALFNDHQFEEAESILSSVKDVEGPYSAPAHYYYGLLAYNRGRFDDALKSFSKIEQMDAYKGVVPYYIAEIRYFQGQTGAALQKAREEMSRPTPSFYDNEFHLLAAQCLFEQEQYEQALPYFEYYYAKSDQIRKQDLYEMAYSYYRVKSFSKAIEPFRQLSSSQDSLGQTAMYFLGDCFLQTDDKRGAKNAFALAGSMDYNRSIAEHAILLSGKLAFELGYTAEGIAQMQKLLGDYPDGEDRKEATDVLSAQLLQSGNYEEAYNTLQQTPNADPALIQRAAYSLALKQLQQKRYSNAASLLDAAIEKGVPDEYLAAAHFWRSEVAYQLKNYEDAIQHGTAFLQTNSTGVKAIAPNVTVQHALITMGYAALHTGDYNGSAKYFAQAQNKNAAEGFSQKLASDAALREADASFLAKDYARAIALYDKLIAAKGAEADYALFQKSTLLGLQGKTTEQADILLQIVAQRNPVSQYLPEAHYALGDLLLDANKFEDAISHFEKITDQNAPHLASKALVKIAFAYQEAENTSKAIETYQAVIRKYPASEEKQAALDGLKSLYISTNKPDAYLKFLKENNLNTDSGNAGDTDSLYYQAEETQYVAGKYAEATAAMHKYLERYPNGLFSTKAHYYGGEAYYQLKQYDSALTHFDKVLGSGWSDFTEPSAQRAAGIAYTQGNYTASGRYYAQLRNIAESKNELAVAYRGMMFSADRMSDGLAANYADTLLTLPEIDEEMKMEAMLIKGNAAIRKENFEEAASLLQQVAASKNIETAAEAQYQMARLPLLQKKTAAAESAVTEAIRATSGSSYWNTKCYLLMADVFIAQKDYFNAKATLQSIIRNVKNESLRQDATRKLDEVKLLEKGKSKLKEGE
ncbi:tetratricopeptide repeat protein [Rurimicrobium arvi]|uniref:Tetratricopeptide repeat protein n=1 Tax=Rurimicrobium arvi TaxID=2049916 RepID=A0ABP8MDT7_9BACT